MRALTVRQPWAWAIIHGGKDVENRTRNIAGSYRGPVGIHAGLVEDTGEWSALLLRAVMQADFAGGRDRTRGAFVGVVDLVEVHHGDCLTIETYREGHEQRVGTCSPWAEETTHHLVLANPRPLPQPIPARGRLGLWTPADDVLEQLRAVTA